MFLSGLDFEVLKMLAPNIRNENEFVNDFLPRFYQNLEQEPNSTFFTECGSDWMITFGLIVLRLGCFSKITYFVLYKPVFFKFH